MDGERLRKLAHHVAWQALRRRGAWLDANRADDLVGFLLMRALDGVEQWDETRQHKLYGRDGGRHTLAAYLSDVMAKRVIDFWRMKRYGFADRRLYPDGGLQIDYVGMHVDTNLATTSEPTEDMGEAVDELADGLSEGARWALEHLARPMAEGATLTVAATEAGLTVSGAKARLNGLRDELLSLEGR